jgi:hypothetical protein
MGDSIFNGDDVGPCNVIKERLKRVRTPGALSGMCFDSYNRYGTIFKFIFHTLIVNMFVALK